MAVTRHVGLAVHPCSIYSLAATRNMKWIFTGGDDGLIRKYDLEQTMKGESLLTINQRHGFTDSITKSVVLSSAWENEESNSINQTAEFEQSISSPSMKYSPVYSIDCHSEGVWLVSGTKSGLINLYTVRHDEGQVQHIFRKHQNTVSVLKIAPDEKSMISGSWDKSLIHWDLNTGKALREFSEAISQITSASFQNPDQKEFNPNLFLATTFNGQIMIYDLRTSTGIVQNICIPNVPAWCLSACWSSNGEFIYAGRRNGIINEISIHKGGSVRDIKTPKDSGPVSYVHAMKNGRNLVCASFDNIRLWNLDSPETTLKSSIEEETAMVPFSIIPGHHGGMVSSVLIDPEEKFMMSSSGTRGYSGTSTNICALYEISKS